MGMPWAIDHSPSRAHCWLSDNFSVRSETLCLNRPESPNSDYVCVAAKGHRGRCDHRWTGNDWPQFKAMSVREAMTGDLSASTTGISASSAEMNPKPIRCRMTPALTPSVAGEVKPLAVDLFCGLGGWTEGLLSEGWRCRGYDIEVHEYGDEKYPGELIVADVMALTGADVADADLIVASPPCQEFSYMAMPWSRAKQIARALRGQDEFPDGYRGSRTIAELTALFDACFRIQREANEIRAARGQPPIPMVVENVRGATAWLGPAAYNYGSYYLWGDVPALMPAIVNARKVPGFRFDGSGGSFQTASVAAHAEDATKVPALDGGRRTDKGKGARFTSRDCGVERDAIEGRKGFVPEGTKATGKHGHLRILAQIVNSTGSGSKARKAASAKIAKIPVALGSHIARVYRPAALQPSEAA